METEKINVLCIGLSYFKEALVYDPDCQKLKKEFDFVFCDGDEELNTVFQEGRRKEVRFKTAILHPSKCKDAQRTVGMLKQIFPRMRLGIVTAMMREEFVYIDVMNRYAPDFFSGPPDSLPEFIYSQLMVGEVSIAEKRLRGRQMTTPEGIYFLIGGLVETGGMGNIGIERE